jgi:hypothetical protein
VWTQKSPSFVLEGGKRTLSVYEAKLSYGRFSYMSMSDRNFTSVSAGAIDIAVINVPVLLICGLSAALILPEVKQAFIALFSPQGATASHGVSAT